MSSSRHPWSHGGVRIINGVLEVGGEGDAEAAGDPIVVSQAEAGRGVDGIEDGVQGVRESVTVRAVEEEKHGFGD